MRRTVALFSIVILALPVVVVPRAFPQQQRNTDQIVLSNTKFALDLYKRLSMKEGNIFFSPYSISTALAIAHAGARARTASQIATALHFSLEGADLHDAFSELQTRLNEVKMKGNIELSIANALWLQERRPFLKEFQQLARRYYQTEIFQIDFKSLPLVAQSTINSWVEKETRGKIKGILPQPMDRRTTLALTNAIYFEGKWASRFKAADTRELPFYLDGTTVVQVPMMKQTSDLRYAEDNAVQILQMAYDGDDLSMVIVLPRKVEGLRDVEERLSTKAVGAWCAKLHSSPVEVFLPKLTFMVQFNLIPILRAMGMTDAFEELKANFQGIDGNPRGAYIMFASHKAFLDVDEEGTKAAAATVGGGGCFPAGTDVLCADRPCAIEEIRVGAMVWAYDLAAREWTLATVLERKSSWYDGVMVTIAAGQTSIQATENHPFFVLRGDDLALRLHPRDVPQGEQEKPEHGRWVEARDLREGDVLKVKSGGGLIISGLSRRHEKTRVYNLGIEGRHNYAVHQAGVLVHNKAGSESRPPEFRADHPFLFLIRDRMTGSILFMGRISNPLGHDE